MKIYELRTDVNNYQTFHVKSGNEDDLDYFLCHCESKMNDWSPPEVQIYEPLLKRGNFMSSFSSSPILDSFAVDKLLTPLEVSGELLEFAHEDEMFYLFNA